MVAGINGASNSKQNKKNTTEVSWSPPPPKKKKVYKNPGDGSIPGRYPDESLRDYNKRRNQGLIDAMNY